MCWPGYDLIGKVARKMLVVWAATGAQRDGRIDLVVFVCLIFNCGTCLLKNEKTLYYFTGSVHPNQNDGNINKIQGVQR